MRDFDDTVAMFGVISAHVAFAILMILAMPGFLAGFITAILALSLIAMVYRLVRRGGEP